MKWIIGLGNPGSQYADSRHNVGFMVVDALAEQLELQFQDESKHQSAVARGSQVSLIKPLMYMNASGVAARSVLQFYDKQLWEEKQDFASVFVVHDDLDMELGNWKIELGHGPRAHNGLLSLYEHLGTRDFWHVRVGIDGKHRQTEQGKIPGKAYVLQPFAEDERAVLDDTISAILKSQELRTL